MGRWPLALACLLACDAPPRGEALIVVDTDMPVPKIVDHLRVDVYSADGATWWVSRDIYLPDPSSWPASFSVYTNDTQGGASMLVRLRGYRSGYVQDYLGAGVILPSSPAPFDGCCTPDCTTLCTKYWQPSGAPRLRDAAHNDITPTTEPQPLVSIDRLLRVDLVPGMRGKVAVVLAGACAGTQAVLPDPTRSNPSPSDFQTCVDTERTLAPVTSSALDPDLTLPHSTVQGQFEAAFRTSCSDTPRLGEVCVQGGVMIFGSTLGNEDSHLRALPRIAAVPSFLMDDHEYSVGRFEAAVAGGFAWNSAETTINNATVNDDQQSVGTTNCTAYTATALSSPARDALPLDCVGYADARKLCQLQGGDLPLEVQWEYAASASGRRAKDFLTFALVNGLPQCSDVSFARDNNVASADQSKCYTNGSSTFGPAPVDYGQAQNGDVANPPGPLYAMAGNVNELVRDAPASMFANCWLSAPILSPSCLSTSAPGHVVRGSSWDDPGAYVSTSARGAYDSSSPYLTGFRCVR